MGIGGWVPCLCNPRTNRVCVLCSVRRFTRLERLHRRNTGIRYQAATLRVDSIIVLLTVIALVYTRFNSVRQS